MIVRKVKKSIALLGVSAWLLASQLASAAPAESRIPTNHYADFEGIKLHYETVGRGDKALVLVHGWACNADFWRLNIGKLARYHVIAVDLPGHGQSDRPHTSYTMDYFARSIEAVMHDARVKQAVLVGHSMGAPVIRQFYRLYPDQTLALALADGQIVGPRRSDVQQFMESLSKDYAGSVQRLVDGLLVPTKDAELKAEIRSTMLVTPEYVGRSALEGSVDEAIWTEDKINVPVLAILEKSTGWAPDTEAVDRAIAPDLEFHLWTDTGHFLMMEQPDRFNATVVGFVSRKHLL